MPPGESPITATSLPREHRSSLRFDSTLPVEVDGTPALTRNISDRGVYFETDVPHRVGELVQFTVVFNLYGRRHHLSCEGKVVRVDAEGGRIGVAAQLMAPLFADPEHVELTGTASIPEEDDSAELR